MEVAENGYGSDLVCRLGSKVEVRSSCSDEAGESERRIFVEVCRSHGEEENEIGVGNRVREVGVNRNDGEVEGSGFSRLVVVRKLGWKSFTGVSKEARRQSDRVETHEVEI